MALTQVQPQMSLGGPAFSAYANNSQSCNDSSFTKIQINTVEFDTNSNFNTSTYTFTPNVTGYYQINGCVALNPGAALSYMIPFIYKNGTRYKDGNLTFESTTLGQWANVSSLVYFNGTTDNVSLYMYHTGSGTALTTQVGINYTYFNGSMFRSA